MAGGTITDNTASYNGGGVYLERDSAVFKVGGTAIVIDNKLSTGADAPKSNVVFAESTTYISLLTGSDKPSAGMTVWVSGASRIIVNTGAVESDVQYFKADQDGQNVFLWMACSCFPKN